MSTFGLIQDQSFDILDEEQATVTKTETRMVLKKKKKNNVTKPKLNVQNGKQSIFFNRLNG